MKLKVIIIIVAILFLLGCTSQSNTAGTATIKYYDSAGNLISQENVNPSSSGLMSVQDIQGKKYNFNAPNIPTGTYRMDFTFKINNTGNTPVLIGAYNATFQGQETLING